MTAKLNMVHKSTEKQVRIFQTHINVSLWKIDKITVIGLLLLRFRLFTWFFCTLKAC